MTILLPILAMTTLEVVLIVLIVLVLFGGVPYGRTQDWGYPGYSLLGVVLLVLLVILVFRLLHPVAAYP